MTSDLIFLKLGGSLLTDKTTKEALRADVLARLAGEIAAARAERPAMRLVLGHGSGSFGHVAGKKHGTRQGVKTPAQWAGFAEVADAAARLNRHVIAALLNEGVPAFGLPPSASAQVMDGQVEFLMSEQIEKSLDVGLLPVVFGDVAFDAVRGGTIISTEEVMEFLSGGLRPAWFLMAGETTGVFDVHNQVVAEINRVNFQDILPALGASRGTDVTGGMASKVSSMIDLVQSQPGMTVRIFSGLEPGLLHRLLVEPRLQVGTAIRQA